jgi:AcrR family transcriptional regulator
VSHLVAGDSVRARIAAAMVDIVVEHGYEAASVRAICERARVGRSELDARFADKEACFLGLYDEIGDELCADIRAAQEGAGSWHDRIWAAGWAALRFLQDDPARARFFVVEVNGAGNAAQARRDRLLQRLADLVDTGRGELEDPGAASRRTAEIVSGAIYNAVLAALAKGPVEGDITALLPELVYMAVMPYLGSHVAEDALVVQPLR